jgi:hypothetical protein
VKNFLEESFSREPLDWVWWFTPVIPALRRLRQDNHEFKVILGYVTRSCLKKEEEEEKGRGEEGGNLLELPNTCHLFLRTTASAPVFHS